MYFVLVLINNHFYSSFIRLIKPLLFDKHFMASMDVSLIIELGKFIAQFIDILMLAREKDPYVNSTVSVLD